MTENYISTFKPSAYARVFGRALVNQCIQGGSVYGDPMYVCGADQTDQADLVLSVDLNGVETSKTAEEIKEKNLFHKSGDFTSSIDSFVYIPFYQIDTGNVG